MYLFVALVVLASALLTNWLSYVVGEERGRTLEAARCRRVREMDRALAAARREKTRPRWYPADTVGMD